MSVGPNLAKEIIPPQEGSAEQFYVDRNPESIFIRKVESKEVIEIVKISKIKNQPTGMVLIWLF